MKRKGILLLSILILAIFITGCTGGVVTPATDEAKVKSVTQDYFSHKRPKLEQGIKIVVFMGLTDITPPVFSKTQ